MSSRLSFLFSAALPLAVAVACTKPSEQSARLSPGLPAAAVAPISPVAPTASPAKPAAMPTSTTDSIKGKERRPLQPWGHYLLTD